MPSLMEKFSSHLPLYLPYNYPKTRYLDEASIEGAFSSNGGIILQNFHPLESFNLNGSSSSSLDPMFPMQTTYLDPFDNSTFGCVPNFELYEPKIFGNNGTLIPFMNNFNQSEGVEIFGHSQMVTPINMINPSAQIYNPFIYRELGVIKYWPSDEGSCTMPEIEPTKTMAKKGGRGHKKKKTIVKGQWTMEEDRLLIQLVKRYGLRKWSQIAQLLNRRIGKQCRERWQNHLRPNIKKDVWSEEEDKILIKAHEEMGNKWAEIAKKLPGRTENSIKNHWNATKRRQFSKRKCKLKYPRQSSLLEGYIKNLTPEIINAGCRKKPFSSKNYANSSYNKKASSDSCSIDHQLRVDYDFIDVHQDFNFDDQMFEESSINSLLDFAPINHDYGNNVIGYDHHQGISSSETSNDPHVDLGPKMHYEVKKELDLVEMINQVYV